MSLKTLYRKRTVIWPFYFYTIIRTLSINICVIWLLYACVWLCVKYINIIKIIHIIIYISFVY
ncbi:hypothetical protein B9Z08_08370 [Staphylococcus aureus]|nr:hypothetical protein B9Z08_08370 [Staphylococcus aureus]